MVHVTDGPDVYMRLRPLELLLGHFLPPYAVIPVARATISSAFR